MAEASQKVTKPGETAEPPDVTVAVSVTTVPAVTDEEGETVSVVDVGGGVWACAAGAASKATIDIAMQRRIQT